MNDRKSIIHIIRENSEEEEGTIQDEDAENIGLFDNGGVILCFIMKHQIEYGKAVYVTGSMPILGNWCPNKAVRLT